MSKTVDERVVEMRFDNRQFERNVSTTMSTLEKLKQRLNLTGASKGLENLNAAAKNVDMTGLEKGVEAVRVKFSALEVVSIAALANITNSAVNTGKRLVESLTIDQITAGWDKYSQKTASVQTIMNATGKSIDEVNGYLDKLMWFSDETSYGFTDMTAALGQLTSAGGDIDKLIPMITGIANATAFAGKGAAEFSRSIYNLNQSYSAGYLQYMDWRSLELAGVASKQLKQTFIDTAVALGKIKEGEITIGTFAETLKDKWADQEVMETAFGKFGEMTEKAYQMVQAGEVETASEAYAMLAEQYDGVSITAAKAAQEAKTFSEAIDATKDAVSSGWMKTFELIFGNYDEAKVLWTDLANSLWDAFASGAEARNDMLSSWKELGGRDDLIDSFWNAWEGVASVINPVKEAFREVFPLVTAEQLHGFIEGLKNLTEKLKLSKENAEKLKRTFIGIFSVFSVAANGISAVAKGAFSLVGSFTGIEDGILGATAIFGDWLSNLRNFVKETGTFEKAIKTVAGFFTGVIEKVREFGSSLRFEGFADFLNGIFGLITKAGEAVGGVFSSALSGLNGGGFFELLNGGLLAGILLGFQKFVHGLSSSFEHSAGIIENVKGILGDVRECFKAYQEQLKAGALLKIASAIAILAGAILMLSTVDEGTLMNSLGAISILFLELTASLAALAKLSINTSGMTKASVLMIGISAAVAILAVAMKRLSSIAPEDITKGIIAIGVLMAELSIFLKASDFSKKMGSTAIGIVILSSAMLLLASAIRTFGGIDPSGLIKGVGTIGALLLELAAFTKLTSNAKHIIATGTAMALIASSMMIFASALKSFGEIAPEKIGYGLLAMGGALVEIAVALKLMPKSTILIGSGLIVVAAAMKILANAMSDFNKMSGEEIGRGLLAMGGALTELSVALLLMKQSVAGSVALVIAAGALALIVPIMKSLGSLSLSGIGKGLLALAGAFTVIGVAGLLLKPLIPTLLGLAGAITLFGAGIALTGIGLAAIAAGISALAAATAGGATAIVAGLTVIVAGFLDLIPTIAEKLGEGIVAFSMVIGEHAPELAESFLKLITEALSSLATHGPEIVDSLLTFGIGIIESLAEHIPALITAVVNLVGALFKGIVEAFSIDTDSLLKGVLAIGLVTALMYALSGVVALIPGAMAGALGVGIVIGELTLVLAAIGGLAQIPGLDWLVSEGGNFLQDIGTAIGQFIGGIAGGMAQGITGALPKMADDLSEFMDHIQPFVEGARGIDSTSMSGVKSLAETILVLTGANLFDGIASWVTGSSSLIRFAEQLVPFGEGIKAYSIAVSGINAEAIAASADAARGLADVANAIPKEGGLWGLIAGDKNLAAFGDGLVPFGEGMKAYSFAVAGVNAEAISNSVSAAKDLVKVVDAIPTSGGFKQALETLWGGGKDTSIIVTSLVPFGDGMKKYSAAVSGINATAISSSVSSAEALMNLINKTAEVDTSGVRSFVSAIDMLGEANVGSFVNAFNDASSGIAPAGTKIMEALSYGIKSETAALTSVADDVVRTITKAISGKASAVSAIGSDIASSLAKGVESNKQATSIAITSMLSMASSEIRGRYDKFYDAGTYLVTGFANGIRANSYKAAAQTAAMAKQAAEAARAALEINSPSKVFARIGQYIPEGMAEGISQYSYYVRDASIVMANNALDSTRKAIASIGTIIGGDIDLQPTIRPVLDLSDVRNRAGTISDLIGMGTSVGMLSNVSAIGSMMNRRNQNGPNEEIVSAINKLRKDMAGTRDVYNINGVTYDDGSNVADAVKALMRAARVERRI